MKRNFMVLMMMLLPASLTAQDMIKNVLFRGNIIDGQTNLPLEARITLESLPYGNYVGLYHGSIINFKFPAPAKYMLFVEAEGYAPFQEILVISGQEPAPVKRLIRLFQPVGQYIKMDKLTFGLGKALLTRASQDELDKVAYLFNRNDKIWIQLEGHSDFRGDARQNMRLSEERVGVVKEYLIERGVNEKSIKTAAFGGSQPLTRNSSRELTEDNRRVEVKIYNYY